MNTGGSFLKQLSSGLALVGALSAPAKADEKVTQAQPILYGYTDQNGGVFLYGTNVEGFGSHCGEHPLVGCVPILDRDQNFLGYQHFTGQPGYVCHWGRRETVPDTHLFDNKPPETLYYPCPEFVVPHPCSTPHFMGSAGSFGYDHYQDAEPRIVFRKTFHAERPETTEFRMMAGESYKIDVTLVSPDRCAFNRVRPDLSFCLTDPEIVVPIFDDPSGINVNCKYPGAYSDIICAYGDDRNAWWKIDANKDTTVRFQPTVGGHPDITYTGEVNVEILDLGRIRQ